MKKKNLNNLELNKKSISNLKKNQIDGGISGRSCRFSDCNDQDPSGYTLAFCGLSTNCGYTEFC